MALNPKFQKKLLIVANVIKKYNTYQSYLHDQSYLQLQLKSDDHVMVWSRSCAKWIHDAIVEKRISTKHNVNLIYLRYFNLDHQITKRIQIPSNHIWVPICIPPKLILISCKDAGQIYDLQQRLPQLGINSKGIAEYREDDADICAKLKRDINECKKYIILFPHYKHWNRFNLPKYIYNKVDIIFKFHSKMFKGAYNHYSKMLKPDGKLIQIPLWVLAKEISVLFVNFRLMNVDRYVPCYLNQCNKRYNIVIPAELYAIIIKYSRDDNLTIEKAQDEILRITQVMP